MVDELTMRFKPLKSLYLILSLSKDEALDSSRRLIGRISCGLEEVQTFLGLEEIAARRRFWPATRAYGP